MLEAPIEIVKAELIEWIEKNELEVCHFYSRHEWEVVKGEDMAKGASLTINIESSPLYTMFNYGQDSRLLEELTAILEKHGYYWELGFSWSLHFWKIIDADSRVLRIQTPTPANAVDVPF